MRFSTALALILCASPVWAETITAPATVDRVTLYGYGASVVRQVAVTAPAGMHEVVVPNLPLDTDPQSLRVSAGDRAVIGSVSLATGRVPATDELTTPAIEAALAEVERLEDVVREHDAAIARIRLTVEATEEEVGFLRSLGQEMDAGTADPAALRALAQMVREEVLAARQSGLDAELAAQEAERAREDDVEALNAAKQTLASLKPQDVDQALLTLTVQTDGTPQVIEITTFTENAGWEPTYDMRLTTAEPAALALDRAVVVSQYSGEDWLNVDLTLSTSRPSEQSAPSELYPLLRRIYEEQPESERYADDAGFASEMVEAPVVVAEPMSVEMQGRTVTYHYPTRVDLRDGVESLRLRLDTVDLVPEVRAVGVPRVDTSAFVVAGITNTTGEVLLPGQAMLYLDGALTGGTWLDLVPAGGTAEFGFGAVDGLVLTRIVPDRVEGEQGFISSENTIEESAVLRVENLTGEDWDMRIIDQVPYSEQEDLVVTYSSEPEPSATDLDDMRGVLAWDFEIAARETREIVLNHSLAWPTDFNLQ